MNVIVTWQDIALRLGAAVLAGAIIGFDRGARGQAAGLRTMILICLAATGAMIEANLMLDVAGRTAGSFTMMDALRFPLGILSGIGFIGAGAIIRRDKLVTGVTTAATLWLITVIGLILGAGYFGTGFSIVGIAFVVLAVLKHIEPLIFREHRGDLIVESAADGLQSEGFQSLIHSEGYRITSVGITQGERQVLRYRLTWSSRQGPGKLPDLVKKLATQKGIVSVSWEPFDTNPHFE